MKYMIQTLDDAKKVDHPFGVVGEFFGYETRPRFDLAHVEMTDDRPHYHGKTTELYYILAGHGKIDLDGDVHKIGPNTAILIKPGTKHRATANPGEKLDFIVFSVPAYDPKDEFPADVEAAR